MCYYENCSWTSVSYEGSVIQFETRYNQTNKSLSFVDDQNVGHP